MVFNIYIYIFYIYYFYVLLFGIYYNIMSFYFAICLYLIGVICFLFNNNYIMLVICLEILLLSICLAFVFISFTLNDCTGICFTLVILPLAGAESAISLAYLVCFYPIKGNLSYI